MSVCVYWYEYMKYCDGLSTRVCPQQVPIVSWIHYNPDHDKVITKDVWMDGWMNE